MAQITHPSIWGWLASDMLLSNGGPQRKAPLQSNKLASLRHLTPGVRVLEFPLQTSFSLITRGFISRGRYQGNSRNGLGGRTGLSLSRGPLPRHASHAKATVGRCQRTCCELISTPPQFTCSSTGVLSSQCATMRPVYSSSTTLVPSFVSIYGERLEKIGEDWRND